MGRKKIYSRPRARKRYRDHKYRAFDRAIDFNFTFEEWDNWWLSNGIDKEDETVATNKNILCMCRYKDTGPYQPNNVYCATMQQNSIDLDHTQFEKKIQTPIGIFPSRRDAAVAYKVHPSMISYYLCKKPNKWFYF